MGRTSWRARAVAVLSVLVAVAACGAMQGGGDAGVEVLVHTIGGIDTSAGPDDPLLWYRHTNATISDRGMDVVVNGTSVYAIGKGASSLAESDLLVTRWTTGGQFVWNRSINMLNNSAPLNGLEWGYEAWCNGSSDVYISGTGTALAKVNAGGTITPMNVSSYDRLTDLDIAGGFIYAGGGKEAGYFDTENEGYLKKFWLNGTLVWQHIYRASFMDVSLRDVEVDGDIIRGVQTRYNGTAISYLLSWNATTGSVLSNVSFGKLQTYELDILNGACYLVGENYSGIVAKVWFNGTVAWIYKITPPQDDAATYMRDLTIQDGYIYACGYMTHQDTRAREGLVGKWTLDGAQLWNYTWDNSGDDYAEGIAADATGIYVTGRRPDYASDLFVMKLRLDGKVPAPIITKNVTSWVLSGRDVRFTGSGTWGDGACRLAWDFGDGSPGVTGTTANATVATHAFATGGTYNVTLTATDADNSTAVASVTVVVVQDAVPSAAIAASNATPWTGATVTFNSTGTPGNAPATYLWRFGAGGTTSTQQNATHVFLAAGTYNVTLAVTDADGDVDVAWVIVVVSDQPGQGSPPPGGLDPGASTMIGAGVAAAGVVVAAISVRQRRLHRARGRQPVP